MSDITIKIDGMSCQHCVMRVKKALEGLSGITRLNVTVGLAEVSFDDTKITRKDIEETITKAGYRVIS